MKSLKEKSQTDILWEGGEEVLSPEKIKEILGKKGKKMNHFEAIEEMRQLAAERGLVEVEIEIDRGTMCEGGYNVRGLFQDKGGNPVEMLWDAAFQDMKISE